MLLGYVRVSTAEQAFDNRTSMQEQERVIRGFAMAEGVSPYDLQIYSDPGVSAAIALKDRPAGSKIWADAKRGDVIVASKLDRLFRDALDAQTCYKEFKQRGVDLILYDMGTTPITRDGMSKFFFIMLSAFADLERNRIHERMAEGKRAKRQNGGHIGGYAPYGYRKIGEGRDARLEENPQEQEILALILEKSRKGRRGIISALDERGFKTRAGTRFSYQQVKRILAAEMRAQ